LGRGLSVTRPFLSAVNAPRALSDLAMLTIREPRSRSDSFLPHLFRPHTVRFGDVNIPEPPPYPRPSGFEFSLAVLKIGALSTIPAE
jgi:hypothetical protein